MTVKGELVAIQKEFGGYTTYVFRNLDTDDLYDKYITMSRYPNWEARNIDIGEKGYVSFKDRIAGEDSWYDGECKMDYKYDHTQFIKFVPEHTVDANVTI